MKKNTKYILICLFTFFLTLPIIFGIFSDFIFIRMVNLVSILILVLGVSSLLYGGHLVEKFVYNNEIFNILQKHDVINSFIQKANRLVVWILFLITMVMEELIFRYYFIGILYVLLNLNIYLSIFISGIGFSLYHIHTWFSFKDFKILSINLIYPFFLALYLGFMFFSFGFFSCIIAHTIIALFMHYNNYRLYYRQKFVS